MHRSHIRTVNAEKIYNIPLYKYRKKKKRLQQFNMYMQKLHTCKYMYLASIPIRPQGTGSRLPPPPSPQLLSLPTYILPISYLYGGTCYLHGSSFLLHVLKKAKSLKESFSESVSSVCYLPPRKTCLKRDVDYLLYRLLTVNVHTSYMYDLVYNTLYRRYQVGKSRYLK